MSEKNFQFALHSVDNLDKEEEIKCRTPNIFKKDQHRILQIFISVYWNDRYIDKR